MAFLNEQGLTTLWNKIDDKFARSSEVEEMVDKKPGRIVEGETFTYTIDDVETTAVAETGAEIFNDLNINIVSFIFFRINYFINFFICAKIG